MIDEKKNETKYFFLRVCRICIVIGLINYVVRIIIKKKALMNRTYFSFYFLLCFIHYFVQRAHSELSVLQRERTL